MQKIQELFDPSKQLNREIESVVTFGANTEADLSSEIKEYVVTTKLHDNYEKVLEDFQRAFDDGSKEVGIWVSGFYGSGKSSFAKYLGLSFDKSLIIDGVTFGEKLMSRIHDTTIAALHKTIIARHYPEVVMIDLSTQSIAGQQSTVSDIVYYETLKQLGITKSSDQKVMCFVDMLHNEGKYEEFCRIVEEEKGRKWEDIEGNNLFANMVASSLAPRILPAYFPDSNSYREVNITSAQNEKERFTRLYNLVKEKTGKDNIIFVLDEVGQYVAANVNLILNVQGMMQTLKDSFRGKVWVIATAQQTLTEDNHQAQLNSNELYRLNDRFPIKVDIEANDIKEIITKRLLGKSPEGKGFLTTLFYKNEGLLKTGTHLTLQERSIYNQLLTDDLFANLYPFLPVHIDILLALLQKLASRTGGVGLRSVIRLIRDILVDNHFADATIGQLAGPEQFYDVLRTDMSRGAAKEIVIAADKAIQMFTGNALAVRLCKTIAVMQLLDDFNLSFDNICALIYNKVGENVDKTKVRDLLEEISSTEGVTLQEVDGKYQFMTNAILNILEERSKIVPRDPEKAEVMKEVLQDMLTPAPSVNVYGSKTINAGVELTERNRPYVIIQSAGLKLNVRFVEGSDFTTEHQKLLTESTRSENDRVLYWLCTLNKSKEELLQEIVKCKNIRTRHQSETHKEIQAYLRAQGDLLNEKKQQLMRILRDAQANSEVIFRGSPQQVDADTYKTVALKNAAEKVFEKYPLASAQMKGNCVKTFASYENTKTIPDTLNPFKIVNKTDGSINAGHAALAEIKDFIVQRNEVSGQDLLARFEAAPYGWSKDTIRYLVALMLKASIIQIRTAGKDIRVLSDTAVTALDSTPSFNKVGITLNTNGTLTTPELLKAATNLTALFGCSTTAPILGAIATQAYKTMKVQLAQFNKVLPSFEQLNLAGLPTVRKAINYAQRIVDSEGGEAAYLLGKEPDCEKSFRYMMDTIKEDRQSHMIDQVKHIRHVLTEATKIPKMDLLTDFTKKQAEATQVFQDLIKVPDLTAIAADITDLKTKLDSFVQAACVDFKSESMKQAMDFLHQVMASDDYQRLTDQQKQEFQAKLDAIDIDTNGEFIENLQDLVNQFTPMFMIGGRLDTLKKDVEAKAAAASQPTVVVTPTQPQTPQTPDTGDDTTKAGEPQYTPIKVTVKRKLTSRHDLQQVIDSLKALLDTVDDNSPVELNF